MLLLVVAIVGMDGRSGYRACREQPGGVGQLTGGA